MGQKKLARYTIAGMVLVVAAVWSAVGVMPDGKLHVYVCDVGQGDAILAVMGKIQMLVDGGPDERVGECLGKYMQFYDHTLEVVVMTHPQADHMTGLITVVQRYNIGEFVTVNAANSTKQFAALEQVLREKAIKVKFVANGDKIVVGKLAFDVVWPSREFLETHNGRNGTTDLNSFAVVGKLAYGRFDVLLTGDADQAVDSAMLGLGVLSPVEVLKVPHHGSKTGMTRAWLEAVKPQLAVISAGKNNRYGHPAQETLDLLKDEGIEIKRTDVDGTVDIISDGNKWWVREK